MTENENNSQRKRYSCSMTWK